MGQRVAVRTALREQRRREVLSIVFGVVVPIFVMMGAGFTLWLSML